MLNKPMLFFLSFFLAALSCPAYYPVFSLIAAPVAFSLFWFAILDKKRVFWPSTLFFFLVCATQLSWMLSYTYQGLQIFFVHAIFCFILGLQFGLLTLCLKKVHHRPLVALLIIPPLWIFMEWSRLFWFSGFTWHYLGLFWGGSLPLMQAAALGGIYLLSYLLISFNLLFLFWPRSRIYPIAGAFLLVALFAYGDKRIQAYDGIQESPKTKALLFYSREAPSPYLGLDNFSEYAYFSFQKWERIFEEIALREISETDLCLFPESAFFFHSDVFVYPYEEVHHLFTLYFGKNLDDFYPPSKTSHAFDVPSQNGLTTLVSNGYILGALAKYLNCDVIAGLEKAERGEKYRTSYYNAAIHFSPDGKEDWYGKRKLLPVAEYFPFSFVSKLAKTYGIEGAFSPGVAHSFNLKNLKLAPTICSEETFPQVALENSQGEADGMINLSNDVWYPNTSLPEAHLAFGKLRAIELGVPLFRSCNLGVSCAIDPVGREVKRIGENFQQVDNYQEFLACEVKKATLSTLFSKVGDKGMLSLCLFQGLIGLGLLGRRW